MGNRDPNRYNGSSSTTSVNSSGPTRASVSTGGVKLVNVVAPRRNVSTVYKNPNQPTVNVNTYINDVFVQASPGPQGIPGVQGQPGTSAGEEEVYSTRVDFVSENLLYKAEAAVGSLNSAALWRIRRLTISNDGDVSEEWANGNANFTNVWDNRASLEYR